MLGRILRSCFKIVSIATILVSLLNVYAYSAGQRLLVFAVAASKPPLEEVAKAYMCSPR